MCHCALDVTTCHTSDLTHFGSGHVVYKAVRVKKKRCTIIDRKKERLLSAVRSGLGGEMLQFGAKTHLDLLYKPLERK